MTESVFQYTDYRTILRDFFVDSKKRNPSWSYGIWAKKLGLKSPSTLIMIVNGERNPGPNLVKKLSSQLGLRDREKVFFEDLIRLRKAERDPTLALQILERLKKQSPTGQIKLLDDKNFGAIANWYFYAIRELVELADFVEDADWISGRLKYRVTPGQVRHAILILIDLGLLKRQTGGKLVQAVSRIDTTSDIASEGLKRFHEQALDHARQSIRNTGIERRDITGATLPIKLKSLSRAKELIRDFQNEFLHLIAETDAEADEVYHIEISLFPLTYRKRDCRDL